MALYEEMKRCVAHLHETEPGTPPYTATIRAIRSLAELIGAPALDLIADEDAERVRSYGMPESTPPMEEPVKTEPAPEKPEETPRPVEKPEETTADEPKSTSDQPEDDGLPTMADCRAELLKARKRGVKIQELLAQFGAKQFTSVKREDYEALMEAARNA